MSKRPNILYIMVDQQRYDCIGHSRDYPVKTPNIDRLAREGAWFSHAFTHIPLCCPARQSLLNGRRPETFGALWNYDLGSPIPPLEPDAYSWPRELEAQGYRNAYLGKWHVHPTCDPTAFGFSRYVSEEDYETYRKRKYPDLSSGEAEFDWFGRIDPIPLEDAKTHWLARKAIETMEELSADSHPWHIRLEFSEPHLPCNPHPSFAEMYDPAALPEWRSFGETFADKPYIQRQQLVNWRVEHYAWQDWAPIVARYYAMISQVDDAVGHVLGAIKRLGLEEDTVVVFTSDHGDMCGGHRMMDKHYVMYDDVVKVPLIVKYPKRIPAGRTYDELVYNLLDISPTLLDIAGIAPPASMQGRTLLPLLEGHAMPDWRQEVVATYHGQQFGLFTQRMLRTKRWKYIWNATDVDEWYDLAADPDELANAIGNPEHQAMIAQFRRRLYQILHEEGDTMVHNAWMKDQLMNSRKL